MSTTTVPPLAGVSGRRAPAAAGSAYALVAAAGPGHRGAAFVVNSDG